MTIEHMLSTRESAEIQVANASGKTTVIFIHGLWLLASSWHNWVDLFEQAGFATVSADWPDDPETVAQANANPQMLAKKSVADVADHCQAIIEQLDTEPFLIGHSFGGLLAQILAGRGLAKATVAISPAPFRGVLPLPISALRSAWPVLSNPMNLGRTVSLNYKQFKYGFANAVNESEAKSLFSTYHIPAPGLPLFQAATANLNPWTQAKVNTRLADRGPMLIVSGEKDHTVPPAISRASFRLQKRNEGVTELVEMQNRGHALVLDSGWEEVAKKALDFISKHQH